MKAVADEVIAPATVELNGHGEYERRTAVPADPADIRHILDRVSYPKRLLRGLDDISIPMLKSSLSERRLLVLGLRLTNVCNYDCVYCGTADGRGRDRADTLKLAEYLDLIEQAAAIGIRTVIFGANGEPLMTRGLPKILARTAELGLVPIVFTNASVLGNDVLCFRIHGMSGRELLAVIDASGASLIISCETRDRERYNKVMRVDSFDFFEEAIHRIREETTLTRPAFYEGRPLCRIAISSVVMPMNYEDRYVMRDFAHSLNGLIVLKLPSLHGSARVNADAMFGVADAIRIRPELEMLSDKQATLQILTLACASWTLGLSIDNEGRFMACMTEEVNPFTPGSTSHNTRLHNVVGRRIELVKMRNSICPVKDKFYAQSSVATG